MIYRAEASARPSGFMPGKTAADVNPQFRNGSSADQVCSPDMVLFGDYLFKPIISPLIKNDQCALSRGNLLKCHRCHDAAPLGPERQRGARVAQAEMLLGACVVLSLLALLRASPRGFTMCPESCLCYEASDLVDCRARGLWRVPPGVPHGTWLLDMSGNKLLEIHSRSFPGLWALKILLMVNNSIEMVRPQVRHPVSSQWLLT